MSACVPKNANVNCVGYFGNSHAVGDGAVFRSFTAVGSMHDLGEPPSERLRRSGFRVATAELANSEDRAVSRRKGR